MLFWKEKIQERKVSPNKALLINQSLWHPKTYSKTSIICKSDKVGPQKQTNEHYSTTHIAVTAHHENMNDA